MAKQDAIVNSLAVAPSRGRGSKPLFGHKRHYMPDRRPFTGAWIETTQNRLIRPTFRVAPSRGRGSKRCLICQPLAEASVAPSRGRGSKRIRIDRRRSDRRSPLHGGVDRNSRFSRRRSRITCRPFTGAWIETRHDDRGIDGCVVAPSRGRGSKHVVDLRFDDDAVVAPSRGRGSKQVVAAGIFAAAAGRPFTGAWIETLQRQKWQARQRVAPSRGRGSKP